MCRTVQLLNMNINLTFDLLSPPSFFPKKKATKKYSLNIMRKDFSIAFALLKTTGFRDQNYCLYLLFILSLSPQKYFVINEPVRFRHCSVFQLDGAIYHTAKELSIAAMSPWLI